MSRKIFPALLLASLAAMAGTTHAQQPTGGQSMEERLRAQLRATTTQLQQVQNELAALKAGQQQQPAAQTGAAAPAKPELDALKKELSQTQAQLAAERQAREAASAGSQQLRQQAQAASDKATAQVAQYRNAYDELLKMARTSEAERQRLVTDAATHRTAIAQCEAKNTQLYALGQEILRAYETMDVGTVLASRQPFAAQSRVKYEQIAQQYGDKLYESKFDVRAVAAPAPAAPTAAGAPAAGEKEGKQ
ncbi:UNVERIFIED_ORG: chromosome segregation ATPase [Variovorax guangxiensis]